MAAHDSDRTSPRLPSVPRLAVSAFSLVILAAGGAGILIGQAGPAADYDVAAGPDRTARASRDFDRSPMSTPPAPVFGPAIPPGVEVAKITAQKKAASVAKRRAAKKAAATVAVPSSCRRYAGNKRTACALLPKFGFPISEMSALVPMWDHESGWNHRAQNPSSGAYGIPQALPGSKMGTVASDWRTNPATQIRWGLGYIKDRYGSPSQAWGFWQANGWY